MCVHLAATWAHMLVKVLAIQIHPNLKDQLYFVLDIFEVPEEWNFGGIFEVNIYTFIQP